MLEDQPQGPALQGVRIQGFKTALDVRLELGQVNVIFGPNGAGKTNLMEALAVLGCAEQGMKLSTLWTSGALGGMPLL